jgi:hypothetical protein
VEDEPEVSGWGIGNGEVDDTPEEAEQRACRRRRPAGGEAEERRLRGSDSCGRGGGLATAGEGWRSGGGSEEPFLAMSRCGSRAMQGTWSNNFFLFFLDYPSVI